jgi:hypothetical protein
MKLSTFRKIVPENYSSELQPTISLLASTLNPTIDQLSNALNHKLSFADNIQSNIVTLTVSTNRDNTPTTGITLKTTLNTIVQGIIPISVKDVTPNPTTFAINNISAATPTIITTSQVHGFETGYRVSIGKTNSTPVVDGNYIITALSPNTFSIPITVSGSGNTGNVIAVTPNENVRISFVETTVGFVTITTVAGIPANSTYQITAILI